MNTDLIAELRRYVDGITDPQHKRLVMLAVIKLVDIADENRALRKALARVRDDVSLVLNALT